MYSPNPNTPSQTASEMDGPLIVPASYLKQVRHNLSVQKDLLEQRDRIKETSRDHPDHAGRQAERLFAELLKNLIPDEFKIVHRARILTDNPKDSPELDLMILKPGGEKVLNGQDYYPRENVLAAFECKLTLRKSHLAEATATANAIKGSYAKGRASKRYEVSETYPTCTPYYGVLALSWEGGDGPESVTDLVRLLSGSFKSCQIGRQVDCVLVPSISFCSITHEPDPFNERLVDLNVQYEPSFPVYEWPDGLRRPFRPYDHLEFAARPEVGHEKMAHHSSLMGLGNFLAQVVGEHKQEHAFLAHNYTYYGHVTIGARTAYQGPPVNID